MRVVLISTYELGHQPIRAGIVGGVAPGGRLPRSRASIYPAKPSLRSLSARPVWSRSMFRCTPLRGSPCNSLSLCDD